LEKPRVLLADDHKILLEGLKSLLQSEFEIIGIAEDGRALVAAAETLRPDVIVADISMPLLNGIEAARQIKQVDQAGASGFVLKHSAPSELIVAIRETIRGRTYVTPTVAGDLSRSLQCGAVQQEGQFGSLSPRQREVLQLLAEGKSAKEIAAILQVSTRTVEFHKYRMMDQLRIKTSAELVQYAVKHGLTTL
jgi:DNA-binding NarL/FixJ family response regulator